MLVCVLFYTSLFDDIDYMLLLVNHKKHDRCSSYAKSEKTCAITLLKI